MILRKMDSWRNTAGGNLQINICLKAMIAKNRLPHRALRGQLWLALDQVRVITLNDDEALINYAKPIVNELRANMVRVDSDYSATPFKAKISNAEQLRVHTMLVIGGRDMEAGAVSVRLHGKGNVGAKPKVEAVRIFWERSKNEGRRRFFSGKIYA